MDIRTTLNHDPEPLACRLRMQRATELENVRKQQEQQRSFRALQQKALEERRRQQEDLKRRQQEYQAKLVLPS